MTVKVVNADNERMFIMKKFFEEKLFELLLRYRCWRARRTLKRYIRQLEKESAFLDDTDDEDAKFYYTWINCGPVRSEDDD